MDGVEPKPVEMKLFDPIFSVLDEEVAHGSRLGPVKLDRVAPWRLVPVGEEVWRIKPEEVPFGTEVVVNDVEQYRDSALVRSLDKGLEVLGSSVARVRGVRKGSVVAPVPPAFEVADRHDLDGRDPEVREVVQFKGGSRKHALRRESADMEFVENDVVPFAAVPGFLPPVRARIYYLARSVDVVRLKARRRIGNALSARQSKHVTRACR